MTMIGKVFWASLPIIFVVGCTLAIIFGSARIGHESAPPLSWSDGRQLAAVVMLCGGSGLIGFAAGLYAMIFAGEMDD